nr:LysM peptidoglycan-binding domain-containing protein [Pseudomonadota bacterium]
MIRVTRSYLLLAAGTLTLAACSGGPSHVRHAPAPGSSVAASESDQIFDLLIQGKDDAARKRLRAILKREPMNAQALMLRDSIERDPKELLGPQSYPYAVHEGDTIVTLSQHFLGNRLKAIQLARYNALAAPYTLSAGQPLRIPGEPPRVEPERRPEAAPSRPTPAPAAPKPKPALA